MAENLFPDSFLWGASTSAHQVEGGQHNDWTEWEKTHAWKLAKDAPKYYSKHSPVWPEIMLQATDHNNYISGVACDHWNRYQEDYDIAQKLGLNAFRLSLDWSRIQPAEDRFDQAAIEHYRQMIKALKARGLEPFVTIWHWPLPLWLSRTGGWANKEISHYFIGYVATVVREFGQDVKFWVTLNEPNVYTENSYFAGHWPPQLRSPRSFYLAVDNLIKSHREAYHIIKSIQPEAEVGIANNFIPYIAYRGRWINKILKRYADLRWNYTFLYRVRGHLDFIGVNHYFRYRINFGFNKPSDYPRSDLGWELYPPAMYQTLRGLRKYKLPIYITESGLADGKDRYRGWFIRETIKQIGRALQHGVDVRGYLHWSLLDNFEWDKGFWPRFGLVEVNYKTQERRIRPSAWEYAQIIKAGGINDTTASAPPTPSEIAESR